MAGTCRAEELQMLMTKWGETVTADNVHPEYPRPQMVRENWQNLNGLWDYAITDKSETPDEYTGQILVPFPIESTLSGVEKSVKADQLLWYQRKFSVSNEGNQRVLLHFGAVDWETTVYVNGTEVGSHKGGYDPFTFDITDALNSTGEQDLVVRVYDPTDASTQPLGKQTHEPRSIWYTPTTGIWQTVWLEIVPETYISSFRIIPNIDEGTLRVIPQIAGKAEGLQVSARAFDGGEPVAISAVTGDDTLTLTIEDAKLWSPENPFLYDLKLTLLDGDTVVDTVDSYFGMRKIELVPDAKGALRIALNGELVFNYGLLDQGFFPDGLYTAPNDDALRYDIEITKELGFNTIRKHVKVEPARWYYWADKLGVLVWQDMPSGEERVDRGEGQIERSQESADQFELEYERMVDYLYNYPSIVMWVVFNEGWGQYDTVRVTEFAQSLDDTRLLNSVTGWNDMGVGHFHDIHSYPGPEMPPESPGRGLVLGEFGGLGLPVEGHMWVTDFWGYRAYDSEEELTAAYTELIEKLRPMIEEQGLCAAIYTQTTDVETEANGMLTYDRAVMKMDINTVRELNESLYGLETK